LISVLCGGFRQKVGSFSEENQSKKKWRMANKRAEI
jgi:hypothetical protein